MGRVVACCGFTHARVRSLAPCPLRMHVYPTHATPAVSWQRCCSPASESARTETALRMHLHSNSGTGACMHAHREILDIASGQGEGSARRRLQADDR